jgi:molybdopterin biosynthesis enzyme
MTKLTKSVRSTIKEVIQKQGATGSAQVRDINTSVIRDLLRDDHGILIRFKTLRKIAEQV